MEDIFEVKFIDGELTVIDSDGRVIIRQRYYPDGSLEQWNEDAAMAWWESNKIHYYKYPKIQPEEPTQDQPEENI